MEKLMKPAEYAQELGISRQAVYAKIKRGILTAKNVEGKLYIVVDTEAQEETTPANQTAEKPKASTAKRVSNTTPNAGAKDYKSLLQAKDETISVLKGTVKDLKKSNKQISSTLRGEIDLLKEAFYEMRTLYTNQLEHKKPKEHEEVIEVDSEEDAQWISLKKFFKLEGVGKEKKQEVLKKRLTKAYKHGDDRLMKVEGKLKLNANKSFEDILKK